MKNRLDFLSSKTIKHTDKYEIASKGPVYNIDTNENEGLDYDEVMRIAAAKEPVLIDGQCWIIRGVESFPLGPDIRRLQTKLGLLVKEYIPVKTTDHDVLKP
jgi:hypothetical protein